MAKRRIRRRRRKGLGAVPRLSSCQRLEVEAETRRGGIRTVGTFSATRRGWEAAKAMARRHGKGRGNQATVQAIRCTADYGRQDTFAAYLCAGGTCEMNQPLALSGTRKKRKATKKRRSLKGTKRRSTKRKSAKRRPTKRRSIRGTRRKAAPKRRRKTTKRRR